MESLETFAATKLEALEARHLRRSVTETWRTDALWVERGGRRLLSFSCNDYLNLTHHPQVKDAARAAIAKYGAGAGASRLVTGDHPVIERLERRLAAFKGAEAACVFGSGYLANVGIVPTLAGDPHDVIYIDELAHACLWAGASLSGAEIVRFPHNDVRRLGDLIRAGRAEKRHALVLTDGVFSMDGDLAPLDELAPLCAEHDVWLMVDDAHGMGVLGEGRGSARLFPGARAPLQMGTLSKALGSYGGYLCASRAVIDLIKTRARSFIYSTGLPPASAAAALAALDVIEAEPARVARPLANAQRFTRAANLALAASPIVPVMIGGAEGALGAAAALEAAGFLVVAIRPPTVPEGTARLRIAFTAAHDDAQIDALAAAVCRAAPGPSRQIPPAAPRASATSTTEAQS
jgi:8-amino-7-oxononanoate synthase